MSLPEPIFNFKVAEMSVFLVILNRTVHQVFMEDRTVLNVIKIFRPIISGTSSLEDKTAHRLLSPTFAVVIYKLKLI